MKAHRTQPGPGFSSLEDEDRCLLAVLTKLRQFRAYDSLQSACSEALNDPRRRNDPTFWVLSGAAALALGDQAAAAEFFDAFIDLVLSRASFSASSALDLVELSQSILIEFDDQLSPEGTELMQSLIRQVKPKIL